MSLITELKVPPTNTYQGLKSSFLSNNQNWYNEPYTCGKDIQGPDVWVWDNDVEHFSMPFLNRPGPFYRTPRPESHEPRPLVDVLRLLEEIFSYNGRKLGCVFRCNINMLRYAPEEKSWSAPHVDHRFPHKNLLLYLTPECTTGGKTRVYKETCTGLKGIENRPKFEEYEEYTPKEDTAIMFDGMNYHQGQCPTTFGERRILLVATFCEEF